MRSDHSLEAFLAELAAIDAGVRSRQELRLRHGHALSTRHCSPPSLIRRSRLSKSWAAETTAEERAPELHAVPGLVPGLWQVER